MSPIAIAWLWMRRCLALLTGRPGAACALPMPLTAQPDQGGSQRAPETAPEHRRPAMADWPLLVEHHDLRPLRRYENSEQRGGFGRAPVLAWQGGRGEEGGGI